MSVNTARFRCRDRLLYQRSIQTFAFVIACALPLLCLTASSPLAFVGRAARLATQQTIPKPLELSYSLDLACPMTHLMEVEITASPVRSATLDFALLAWAPGRYATYDVATNVQEFTALGAIGKNLSRSQRDEQTWTVDLKNCGGMVLVRYNVFGNDLSGSLSEFDNPHANINGASEFVYLIGFKTNPLGLTTHSPP